MIGKKKSFKAKTPPKDGMRIKIKSLQIAARLLSIHQNPPAQMNNGQWLALVAAELLIITCVQIGIFILFI